MRTWPYIIISFIFIILEKYVPSLTHLPYFIFIQWSAIVLIVSRYRRDLLILFFLTVFVYDVYSGLPLGWTTAFFIFAAATLHFIKKVAPIDKTFYWIPASLVIVLVYYFSSFAVFSQFNLDQFFLIFVTWVINTAVIAIVLKMFRNIIYGQIVQN